MVMPMYEVSDYIKSVESKLNEVGINDFNVVSGYFKGDVLPVVIINSSDREKFMNNIEMFAHDLVVFVIGGEVMEV